MILFQAPQLLTEIIAIMTAIICLVLTARRAPRLALHIHSSTESWHLPFNFSSISRMLDYGSTGNTNLRLVGCNFLLLLGQWSERTISQGSN